MVLYAKAVITCLAAKYRSVAVTVLLLSALKFLPDTCVTMMDLMLLLMRHPMD